MRKHASPLRFRRDTFVHRESTWQGQTKQVTLYHPRLVVRENVATIATAFTGKYSPTRGRLSCTSSPPYTKYSCVSRARAHTDSCTCHATRARASSKHYAVATLSVRRSLRVIRFTNDQARSRWISV